MPEHWARLVAEWSEAGVVDADTAERIRAFEAGRAGATRWRWPMWLALAFGGLMLGAGVLLFVAAHWDELSPAVRFGVVLVSTALFHVAGASLAERHPALASTLHATGTIALGGGVFLAGQIFNLAEHWPGGVMLWALGAVIGWLLLRDGPQLVFVALLVPFWIGSEWVLVTERDQYVGTRVLASGTALLALTYFTAVTAYPTSIARRVLHIVGAFLLLPAALTLALVPLDVSWRTAEMVPSLTRTIGWVVAISAPLLVAVLLRRADAWPNFVAAAWVVGLLALQTMPNHIPLYPWWALGAAGLSAWGVRDGQGSRINMGAAIFAVTVLAFYFSEVMTKLGRSASLIGLGLVFLAGGWALERARRHFVRQTKGDRS